MSTKRHHQRWYLIGLSVALLALMTAAFWQTSLSFGEFRPSDLQQTLLLWGISTLVFLGMVTLGFVLFRNMLKLYIERRAGQLGSKIKTKLVAGALALTILPVTFLFIFAFTVLNRTLDKWFSQPIERIQRDSAELALRLREAGRDKAETLAEWIASLPEVRAALRRGAGGPPLDETLRRFAVEQQLAYAAVLAAAGREPLAEYAGEPGLSGRWNQASRAVRSEAEPEALVLAERPGPEGGRVVVGWPLPADLAARQAEIATQFRSYQEQARYWKFMRYFYVGMLALITLFILFAATWVALLLSRQIVAPIEALAKATAQVSSGRLDYRIQTRAIDELGMLVRSFNEMTAQLEHSRDELDARRRFTEAILESIPTGVISLGASGDILRVNPALGRIFTPQHASQARRLEDLFGGENLAEVRRLIRRAHRIGLASGPLDFTADGQIRRLAVTVSALEPADSSRGCVIVIEDTSELLRAQKSAAWQEVAQRVAHEIKNPLTPIALSAERMSRLVDRYGPHQDAETRLELERLLRNCTATITREVEAVRTLVDEFSQFARFPHSEPSPGDVNEVVETALEACDGRLDGLRIDKRLTPGLPLAAVDREQFKRAMVNLLENAIDAMREEPGSADGRVLTIATALGPAGDTIELVVADSGHGIAPQDREKLFLPYFSTRKRGTGLGLAIVSRIVTEHKGAIRVEDNQPRGARFIVELPVAEPASLAAAERS